MTTQPKRYLTLLIGVFLLFLVSACGPSNNTTGTGGTGGGSTATAAPQKLTVPQLLQKSSDAMKKVTSMHFNMGMSADVSYTTTSASAQQTAITLQGSGDEAGQNKVAMDMNVGISSMQIKLSEILLDSKVYFKNTKGQWYVLDKSTAGVSSLTGTQDYSKFLDVAKKGQYTDHGVETYNGEQLHHVTYTFGKDLIQDIFDAMGQSSSVTPAIKQELNAFNISQLTLDTYTDDATSYVHHIQMKMSMSLNTDAKKTPVATPVAGGNSMDMRYTISMDFSKFNVPVNISAPANAIPATNMNEIFS